MPADGKDIEEEIRSKVDEFNEIYDELVNHEFGAIIQKIQRVKGDDCTRFEHSHAKPSEIYSIKPKMNNILGALAESRDKSTVQADIDAQPGPASDNLLDESPSPPKIE